MTHRAKVGFIGLGVMGEPIAANLLRSGRALVTRSSTGHRRRRSAIDGVQSGFSLLAKHGSRSQHPVRRRRVGGSFTGG
ncbi:MAG: NAD(P)-binding domain-containing protein [Geminicoccales bacterium]